MRLVGDKKTAEPRDAVLIRRLAVALAEYQGTGYNRERDLAVKLLTVTLVNELRLNGG